MDPRNITGTPSDPDLDGRDKQSLGVLLEMGKMMPADFLVILVNAYQIDG